MKQDNAERHVIFAFAVLLLLFAGFTFFVASIVRASPVRKARRAVRRSIQSAACATVKMEEALRWRNQEYSGLAFSRGREANRRGNRADNF